MELQERVCVSGFGSLLVILALLTVVTHITKRCFSKLLWLKGACKHEERRDIVVLVECSRCQLLNGWAADSVLLDVSKCSSFWACHQLCLSLGLFQTVGIFQNVVWRLAAIAKIFLLLGSKSCISKSCSALMVPSQMSSWIIHDAMCPSRPLDKRRFYLQNSFILWLIRHSCSKFEFLTFINKRLHFSSG